MKANRWGLWMAGLGAAMLTLGCATKGIHKAYPGPVQPLADLATIWGTTSEARNIVSPSRERLSFAAIDGRGTLPWYSPLAYPRAVYVTPGKHKLGIQYEYVHGVARADIWVEAQTNRIYQVKVMNPEERTKLLYFVIRDITAQALVGSAEAPAQ